MVLREEQKALREEQLRARENQQQFRDDMSKLLDTIREMTIAVARLEKGPRKEHNPVEAYKLELVPTPPPPRASFPISPLLHL